MPYLPTTREEMEVLGWESCEVVLVSGDTYLDSPFIGVALIGRLLEQAGYRVGIIAQPSLSEPKDITRLGEPTLFWGVSGGNCDSMVANYTALGKPRRTDDFTPGGLNNRRPNRAMINYCNLIRRYFKDTVPLVIGGIEASLRRIAHYDYWSNAIRRSILVDARADVLVYGMGEKAMLELARRLKERKDWRDIRGICYLSDNPPPKYIRLPSYFESAKDKQSFITMFRTFYVQQDAVRGRGLVQQQDTRYLVHNPPMPPLGTAELDNLHSLPFTRQTHPFYSRQGKVKAETMLRWSLTSHRGCYGECHFCAISVHQGRHVTYRSEQSLLEEAEQFSAYRDFKGTISDLGGPTANMFGFECTKKQRIGACRKKRCIYPNICEELQVSHEPLLRIMNRIRKLPGVKKLAIASGIRHDMVMHDQQYGEAYLESLVRFHTSGQLKIAPEHANPKVLALMGKPSMKSLHKFVALFRKLNRKWRKKQFLTYYFIAAHPGCDMQDMKTVNDMIRHTLHITPEQVQIFTPTPGTWSSVMYYTGLNPFTGEPLYVEKDIRKKQAQKECIQRKKGRKR